MAQNAEPLVIKRYGGGRLYDGVRGVYVDKNHVLAMARRRAPFVVIDAKTGDDVTYSLLPILVER